MPVTNRHIVIDNGSTSSAAGTWSVPTVIQEKRLTVTSLDEWCKSSTKVITESTKLTATTPVAIRPTLFSLWVRPKSSTARKPTIGASRIQVATGPISALHLREFVDRGRRTSPEDRDDDAETDGHFGRRHHHHEEDDRLAA